MKQSILYVVIPCYNEEEVLNETVKRLTEKFQQMIYDEMISGKSRIMLVNDGSKDGLLLKNCIMIMNLLLVSIYLEIEDIRMLCWQA